MISFKTYYNLSEAVFATNRFDKYYSKVIEKLINGEKVYLGKTKNENDFIQLDNTKHAKLIDSLNTVSTVEEFNNAFANSDDSSLSKIKWTKLFKGDFSKQSNKGTTFEFNFVDQIKTDETVQKKLAKYFNVPVDIIKKCEVKPVGEQNNKRPLTFNKVNGKDIITCGTTGDNFNIGNLVSDITLINGNDKYYISCKYGNRTKFVNSGVKKLFPKAWFDDTKDTENTKLPEDGKLLLNMLGLDANKFKEAFNKYSADKTNKKTELTKTKERVDIKDKLETNETFKTFMKSVIGYGYIMAHADSQNNIHYIDLLTEGKLDEFLEGLDNATVLYPNGSAKQVDIIIEYKYITFNINMRAKTGGIYPTHILADYVFKN